MNVDALNRIPLDEARATLKRCCHSSRWVDEMLRRRPFASNDALFLAAGECETQMEKTDWLEAFAGHPRIGDVDGLRKKFATTADWSSGEQAGVAGAADAILHELAEGNRLYEERFGHIFIVCATGKSAAEMLHLLRERLPNDPETELRVAAAEQAKITRLRLEKA
ncbi:MAG: 2-oxo-4-hydroxy-4-carboxy-5-ureidoimidazoline decarboxylase [Planctomycetes bacterium]|nr:2-oxo-4-hydroxy-4-carboxy-5-ureidoimidazoline decarboxylase [Planctomycetota bacterium]